MPFHLYVKPDGSADISEYKLNLELGPFRGYQYLGESETKPDVDGKKYVNTRWEWGSVEPEYVWQRRAAYPPPRELLQALWQAMHAGLLPMFPGFYDKIKEVNDRFPPTR
jgi:hypothetical protein